MLTISHHEAVKVHFGAKAPVKLPWHNIESKECVIYRVVSNNYTSIQFSLNEDKPNRPLHKLVVHIAPGVEIINIPAKYAFVKQISNGECLATLLSINIMEQREITLSYGME